MKLKNILIVVKDIDCSKAFYKGLFGLEVLVEFQGNAATDTKSTSVAYDWKRKEIVQLTFTNNDYPSQDIPMNKVLQCAGDANQCYLLLEAFKLKEALAGGKLKGELKAIAEKLDEEDNPVVMIIEFKE